MTTRRGFLAGILAAGFAPAAIGSGVLMPVRAIVLTDDEIITGEPSPYTSLAEGLFKPGRILWVGNDRRLLMGEDKNLRFDTMDAALKAARPGDDIYVMSGHHEINAIEMPRLGTLTVAGDAQLVIPRCTSLCAVGLASIPR